VVKPDEQPKNDRVARGEAIGKVQFANMVNHVNGNFYGSALTGFPLWQECLLPRMPGKHPVLSMPSHRWPALDGSVHQFGGSAVVQLLPWAVGSEAAR